MAPRAGAGWTVAPTSPDHAEALAELTRIVFPTLHPSECFGADHYRRHVEIFPEGQFVALTDVPPHTPVASTTTLRLNVDLRHPQHRFPEFLGGLFLTAHDPAGEWALRRRPRSPSGLEAAGDCPRALRGPARDSPTTRPARASSPSAWLNGYGAVADRMSAEDYYGRLVAGEIQDPTVSAQMRIGFRPEGLIPDYVQDPRCGGYGVLLTLPADQSVSFR